MAPTRKPGSERVGLMATGERRGERLTSRCERLIRPWSDPGPISRVVESNRIEAKRMGIIWAILKFRPLFRISDCVNENVNAPCQTTIT